MATMNVKSGTRYRQRGKMKFNHEHKVIINTLTYDEAVAFTKFLASEIIRHYDDIEQAIRLIELVRKQCLNQ